jgi:preprotein translocase subunit SecF
MGDNKENREENTEQGTEENKRQENSIENNTIDNSQTTTENTDTQKEETNKKPFKLKIPSIKLIFSGIKDIYENQYKKLLIIPFAILFISIILIGVHVATTGDFINRDVSLKGGITITVPTTKEINLLSLENTLAARFPHNDISTKTLSQFGRQAGIIVEADVAEENLDLLIGIIGDELNAKLTQNDYSIEIVGSSLGASFFKEIITALIIAFFFMALVVFLYFRTIIPSLAVILAALSDILVTLTIVNLMDIKLSAAGIAAFLMLIGYSVDTDILLSTRVLKRKEGSVMERIYGAFKTGITMSLTTLIAVSVALIFAQSEVIKQIMTILLIGLVVDLINTWIQNVGLLRLYLERKAKKGRV